MSKIGIENLGGHLLSDVAGVIKEADRAVHAALDLTLLTLPKVSGKGLVTALRPFIISGVAALAFLIPSLPARAQGDGQELYQIVQAYSALGIHRVGTDVDAKTIDWFSTELERRGGKVTRQPFTFDRYDATSTVTIDGQEIPSMPLYYEGVGTIASDGPFVAAVNVVAGEITSSALSEAIAQARSARATVAVIASVNPLGQLQTPNRAAKIGSGLPVVLVPGSFAEKLKTGKVSVRFTGKIVPGRSENVVAAFGDVSKSPIVISTPLSGWFTCAAERGTGIAIAIRLAQRLAARHSVVVVGSPGHEILPHIGLEAYLRQTRLDPALVIQLGANVALGTKDPTTGKLHLAPGTNDLAHPPAVFRSALIRMDPATFERLKPALGSADLPAVLNPPELFGEGKQWGDVVKSPLMEFVGLGPQFHTPADVPEAVTSPELLGQVYGGIETAVDTWSRLYSSK